MERSGSRELNHCAWLGTIGSAGLARAPGFPFDADHYREVPPGPIRPEAFYRRVAPLATISVEGTHRRDLTVFRWRGGGEAVMVPMAIATVVEEARGVRRDQVLQTAADVLTIRLDHDPGADRAEVWQRVRSGWPTCCGATGQSTSSCAWRTGLRTRTCAAEAPARVAGSVFGGFSKSMIRRN